jgi:hypothetical protein
MYLETDEGDDQQDSAFMSGAGAGQGPGVGGRVACYPQLSCGSSS